MEYYLIALIMLTGAFLQGITGFGSGLLAVPLLSLLLPLPVLTPLVSIVNVFMAGYLCWLLRHYLHVRRWHSLLVAGMLGSLLGNQLLHWVPVATLQLGMALLVIGLGVLFWFGVQWQLKATRPLQVGVGLLAGISNGALTLGGPPVVLFLTASRLHQTEFRATLAVFFLAIGLTNVVSFASQGSYQNLDITLIAALLAGAISGAYLGHRVSGKLSEQVFRKLALLLIISSGVVALLTR